MRGRSLAGIPGHRRRHGASTRGPDELGSSRDSIAVRDPRAEASILETLLTASQEAIILLGDTRQISVFSAGAADMFGYAPSDVVGRRIDLLLPDTVPDLHWSSPLPHVLEQNQSERISAAKLALLGRRFDGEIVSLDVTVTCAVVPPDRGCMLMLRDASSVHTRGEASA